MWFIISIFLLALSQLGLYTFAGFTKEACLIGFVVGTLFITLFTMKRI